jgi:hypothetical protein
MTENLVLTVGIPARNRPALLERSLGVLASSPPAWQALTEVIVSDDSDNGAIAPVVDRFVARWHGGVTYQRNVPPLGMAQNWNAILDAARAAYVLLLHDDDFLLRRGLERVLERLRSRRGEPPCALFGVDVVDLEGRRLKRQTAWRATWLTPEQSVRQLLTNSSFVRFPGMVVPRDLVAHVGHFDPTIGGPADLDMWLRATALRGLWRFPEVTAGYTVHAGALTSGMFEPAVIRTLDRFFATPPATVLLAPKEIQRRRSDFFHQFVLAGCWRALRAHDLERAQRAFDLFDVDVLADLPPSRRWAAHRLALGAIIAGVRLRTARMNGQ